MLVLVLVVVGLRGIVDAVEVAVVRGHVVAHVSGRVLAPDHVLQVAAPLEVRPSGVLFLEVLLVQADPERHAGVHAAGAVGGALDGRLGDVYAVGVFAGHDEPGVGPMIARVAVGLVEVEALPGIYERRLRRVCLWRKCRCHRGKQAHRREEHSESDAQRLPS